LAIEIVIISQERCSDLLGLRSLLYAVSTGKAGIINFVSFVVNCCIENSLNSVLFFLIHSKLSRIYVLNSSFIMKGSR